MYYRLLSILLLVFTFLISALGARTIYIPTEVPTIQEGINIAEPGDTVKVLPGLYYESRIDFLGKAIVVMSTDPMDPAVVASTIVDGGSNGSVFYFKNNEDITSMLAGFTVRNGRGNGGGGILISGASPIITRNVISDNSAILQGGGITISNSHAIISHNTITRNSLVEEYEEGGGIRIYSADPVISNNVISENTADFGGGIYCNLLAYPTFTENTVINNTAWHGGGIHCDQSTEVDVSNTIFWGNTASLGSQIYMGALYYPARNTFTIDYSNVEGGEAGVFMGEWDILNWGEHMMDTIPDFSGDGYHLNSYSPLRNAGDPDYSVPGETDIDGESRIQENRIDIGADEIKAMHVREDNPPAIAREQLQICVE